MGISGDLSEHIFCIIIITRFTQDLVIAPDDCIGCNDNFIVCQRTLKETAFCCEIYSAIDFPSSPSGKVSGYSLTTMSNFKTQFPEASADVLANGTQE